LCLTLFAEIEVEKEHPQGACLNLAPSDLQQQMNSAPHQCDLNLPPSDLQQEMHGKVTTSYPFSF
jgi:hypothetical protein